MKAQANGGPIGRTPRRPQDFSRQGGDLERFEIFEDEFLHETFADFERAVLQDNITLCDAKSGILLTFTGAVVIFCLNGVNLAPEPHRIADWASLGETVGYIGAAASCLISCAFSFATIKPRIQREHVDDHIFWEAPAFRLPVESYIARMHAMDLRSAHDEKLRHLHALAGICRTKYAHLGHAMNFALAGFVLLVLAELARALP
ncbi:Pycsar system effector family protein [Methylocapsa palsarum]|uniref:Pycsar effector protein domain-containing protein n=1 Tax=Methylocapsa palsarum TaxID=1612308 RepID=A0A1I4BM00_9HYPH|nr:Pycsar system effector family protein [Methylocapsa palsarum]SFK68996.1 hypothetical protein SAMN05444581_11552 [Methylocapsa palsarum]